MSGTKISVKTAWSSSSPEMVEAYITSPIEAIANTVTNVHKVSSSSTEGNSSVTIELLRGTNTDFAALELNERLSLIREKLPPGTQPPQVTKYVPREFQTDDFS